MVPLPPRKPFMGGRPAPYSICYYQDLARHLPQPPLLRAATQPPSSHFMRPQSYNAASSEALGESLGETASGADLCGSSTYSNKNCAIDLSIKSWACSCVSQICITLLAFFVAGGVWSRQKYTRHSWTGVWHIIIEQQHQ